MKLNKKNILLIMCIVAAVGILGTAGFLLLKGISRLEKTKRKLNMSINTLKDFYQKDPFPSDKNVAQTKQNLKVLQHWSDRLITKLREKQIEPTAEKSPSIFMRLLSGKSNELIEYAKANSVHLPQDFAFGFNRYFASSVPPVPEDVPKLTQQLLIIEKLCKTLFKERIKEVSTISRNKFEVERHPARPRRLQENCFLSRHLLP